MSKFSRTIRQNPNIADMYLNPAFRLKQGRHTNGNQLTHFWNYIGARYLQPCKFECEICYAPIHVRGKRKYLVCKRCLHKYLADVQTGKRTPKLLLRPVAVQT